MNKEDHFIDTDKLGDVLLEFSKKISRFSQNIPDTLKDKAGWDSGCGFIWKFDRIFKKYTR